jgi:hypothetical protein
VIAVGRLNTDLAAYILVELTAELSTDAQALQASAALWRYGPVFKDAQSLGASLCRVP